MLDVAEVLAVDLKRERPIAADLEPIRVVCVQKVAPACIASWFQKIAYVPMRPWRW